jgi:hypothetical protein
MGGGGGNSLIPSSQQGWTSPSMVWGPIQNGQHACGARREGRRYDGQHTLDPLPSSGLLFVHTDVTDVSLLAHAWLIRMSTKPTNGPHPRPSLRRRYHLGVDLISTVDGEQHETTGKGVGRYIYRIPLADGCGVTNRRDAAPHIFSPFGALVYASEEMECSTFPCHDSWDWALAYASYCPG